MHDDDRRAAPALTLDITNETCPMTYVRTRLALDRMAPGEILEVWLKGDEPRVNVARSAERQGHAVLLVDTDTAGLTRLVVRRGENAGERAG